MYLDTKRMTSADRITIAASLLTFAVSAEASGDVAVVYVFAAQALASVFFLALLFANRRPCSERMFLSAIFFGSIALGIAATRDIPYEPNKHWLVPLLLALPLMSWGVGALLVARSRRRGV